MNGAVYFFWQILLQSIELNQGCCLTSLTLLGLRAGSLARSFLSKSHRKTSFVLFCGMLINFKSGRCSNQEIIQISKYNVKNHSRLQSGMVYLHMMRLNVFLVSPLGSMNGGCPVKNS